MHMIFLIRHGQTEWNKALVFRGRKDIPLSTEGKTQAARTGKYLGRRKIYRIFTSPLMRAVDTANEIAKESHCDVRILESLTDINFGDWEGKTLEWVKQNDPEIFSLFRSHPEKVVFPNGESLDSCCNRAFDGFSTELHRLSIEHTDDVDCVFVTHRVVLKLLLLRAMGLSSSSFWKLQVDTCGLSELDFIDNTFIIKRINSVCHLADEAHESADF